jgi:GAF domain-containing protein
MGTVSRLHQADSLTMPLADGALLRVTPFRESPCVALAFYGPGGGDAGGVILTARRARLLASWLLHLADECGAPPTSSRQAHAGRPRRALGSPASLRDRDAALGELARLAVAVLADWCSIDVLEADGSLRRLPVAHADPSKLAVAKQLEKYAPRPMAEHAEHRDVPTTVGCMSSLVVPLSDRVRTLGVMTLVSAESGHRYADADLLVARELGRLAGLVLESAQVRSNPPADATTRRDAKRRASRPGTLGR